MRLAPSRGAVEHEVLHAPTKPDESISSRPQPSGEPDVGPVEAIYRLGHREAGLPEEPGPLTPARALALVRLTAEDVISSKQAKEVFAAVLDEDKDPAAIVEERGMKQVSDTGAIEAVVDAVLAANPDKVAQYQGGKTGLIGFFVGQCMKEMRGQGNPKLINELLAKKLG